MPATDYKISNQQDAEDLADDAQQEVQNIKDELDADNFTEAAAKALVVKEQMEAIIEWAENQ